MAYDGPDRRVTDIALVAVGQSIDRMTEALETNLSEERLTHIVANEQKRDRVKLLAAVIGPIVVVGVVSAFGLAQSRDNHQQNKDVAVVADYVRHCLQKKTVDMTPAEIKEECGDSQSGSAFFVTYLNCVFPLPIEERTEVKLNGCVAKAIASQASTTTTR